MDIVKIAWKTRPGIRGGRGLNLWWQRRLCSQTCSIVYRYIHIKLSKKWFIRNQRPGVKGPLKINADSTSKSNGHLVQWNVNKLKICERWKPLNTPNIHLTWHRFFLLIFFFFSYSRPHFYMDVVEKTLDDPRNFIVLRTINTYYDF